MMLYSPVDLDLDFAIVVTIQLVKFNRLQIESHVTTS